VEIYRVVTLMATMEETYFQEIRLLGEEEVLK
jgi:hypothetical protein